jgi:hypothetical protein
MVQSCLTHLDKADDPEGERARGARNRLNRASFAKNAPHQTR